MNLLLSPHNDDECLFAAYTLIRKKPLVVIVTDSDMQLERGVTSEQRRQESRRACEYLGVAVAYLGLKDGFVEDEDLQQRLKPFANLTWETVYAPAIEGGHRDHDVIGKIASALFARLCYYSTYYDPAVAPNGDYEIIPTPIEIEMKNRALDFYESQISLSDVRVHFDSVRGKPEYLNDHPQRHLK
jgi:LmbE family N-acetylglucosaminyl deacetylase